MTDDETVSLPRADALAIATYLRASSGLVAAREWADLLDPAGARTIYDDVLDHVRDALQSEQRVRVTRGDAATAVEAVREMLVRWVVNQRPDGALHSFDPDEYHARAALSEVFEALSGTYGVPPLPDPSSRPRPPRTLHPSMLQTPPQPSIKLVTVPEPEVDEAAVEQITEDFDPGGYLRIAHKLISEVIACAANDRKFPRLRLRAAERWLAKGYGDFVMGVEATREKSLHDAAEIVEAFFEGTVGYPGFPDWWREDAYRFLADMGFYSER